MTKFDAAKAERAGKLAGTREVYQAARVALIERQNEETAKVRAAWRQLYAEREQGRRLVWRRGRATNERAGEVPAARSPVPQQGPQFPARDFARAARSAKGEFEKAGQLPVANQSPEPESRAAKWERLSQMGKKSREQGRGLGMQLRRELKRE